MTKAPRTAVIAVGGNSLIKDPTHSAIEYQWAAARETAHHIVDLVEEGWRIVVTHGNGPQVGFILRRSELGVLSDQPAVPLDIIVADTQGGIGYILQQTIHNELQQRHLPRECITMVTRVLVDAHDPAFQHPTKPIGGFMDETTARKFESGGERVVEDAGRGWRRVVASPKPVDILEKGAIDQALSLGWIVIAVGGGGIPVIRKANGDLHGVPAVVDKDLASSLLAVYLQADLLIISTGVAQVSLDFGKPTQRALGLLTVAQAQEYLRAGQFPPGSMQPKIQACINFVEQSPADNARAIVTAPEQIARALNGEAGTQIVKA